MESSQLPLSAFRVGKMLLCSVKTRKAFCSPLQPDTSREKGTDSYSTRAMSAQQGQLLFKMVYRRGRQPVARMMILGGTRHSTAPLPREPAVPWPEPCHSQTQAAPHSGHYPLLALPLSQRWAHGMWERGDGEDVARHVQRVVCLISSQVKYQNFFHHRQKLILPQN